LNREFDAHILRAAVACEMADCENGDRSKLLAADWFIWQAQDVAKEQMSEEEYKEWRELNDTTITSYMELEAKYNALLRSFKREGRQPALAVFYQEGEQVPSVDSCASYKLIQEANQQLDQGSTGRDKWEVFLSVYAQAATVRAIPTIVFSSVISLFMGGLFNILSPNAGTFLKIIGIVWLAITLIITFIRSLTDTNGISGKNLRLYQLIMIGIGLVFSINFFVGLIAYFVLRSMASKYK
jgi:ABC-type nickel/cobalt efflux system permease component RcnA